MASTSIRTLRWTLPALAVVMAIGCAKKNSDDPPPPPAPQAFDGANQAQLTSGNFPGASTEFKFASAEAASAYVVSHPLNSPKNIRINVDLSNFGAGRYGGEVYISYMDNGQLYYGRFSTGKGVVTQPTLNNIDTGKSVAEFNQWILINGKTNFRGFFQDKTGPIILVIDGGFNQGDGGGLTNLSGSVFFRNFKIQPDSGVTLQCWFVRTSTYDCRTWLGSDGNININIPGDPGNGYMKLGTFQNLDRAKAFKD